MKPTTLFLLIVLFSCSSKPEDKVHQLDFGIFTIETPKTWTSQIGYGTFSVELGKIITDDRDTMSFNVSTFANPLTEIDSIIIKQNKIPAFKLIDTGQLLNIDSMKTIDLDQFRKNNITWDTIDNTNAKIIFPRRSGIGTTGIYFEKIPGESYGLVLYGENLKPTNEKLLLAAFRTIKFHKAK